MKDTLHIMSRKYEHDKKDWLDKKLLQHTFHTYASKGDIGNLPDA